MHLPDDRTVHLLLYRFSEAVPDPMTAELSKVNERITLENSKTRADLIKWMFIFWIGQVGALLGILFAFFK
ncbi:MAG: hypothetical protein U5R06_23090 [candidate division KSB1 bacterium]|nr:hypothetical protein [candidate division KSB1 bacterium]